MIRQLQIGGFFASLPLEGRDRGWGSVSGSLNHPLPNPPLKGEGAQEPLAPIQNSKEQSHG